MELKEGDTVKVMRPDDYATAFAEKVRNRLATVVRIWTPLGSRDQRVTVRFHKRRNRGKEFQEVFPVKALHKVCDA